MCCISTKVEPGSVPCNEERSRGEMRLVISKSGGVTSNQEETAWSLDDGEQNVRVADWKSAIQQVGKPALHQGEKSLQPVRVLRVL